MGLTMPSPSEGGTLEPCPEGTTIGICYEILDFGTQSDEYEGKVTRRPKIWIGWEIPNHKMSDGRPFVLGKEYTLSSDERSKLRKDLQSWRGTAWTNEELNGFDITKLLGKPCLLSIEHNKNNKARIQSVMAMPAGMPVPEDLHNPNRLLSLDKGNFDREVFETLPEWMQNRISESPEFQNLLSPSSTSTEQTHAPEQDEVPF